MIREYKIVCNSKKNNVATKKTSFNSALGGLYKKINWVVYSCFRFTRKLILVGLPKTIDYLEHPHFSKYAWKWGKNKFEGQFVIITHILFSKQNSGPQFPNNVLQYEVRILLMSNCWKSNGNFSSKWAFILSKLGTSRSA